MKKLKNPFLLSGYYGKEYFCDRESELGTLQGHFENDRNVVLYSWRRMGKTALIKNFLSMLEEGVKAESLYVDLLGTRDMEMAIKQITQAVYEKFGKTKTGFSLSFQKLLSSIGAQVSFDPYSGMPEFGVHLREKEKEIQRLNALGEFLQARKKQVIIALDEFQQIENYSEKNGEASFRSWMQEFPGLRFIFSGSHRQMMVSMFSDKNRPFYRSSQLIKLDPIPLNVYKDFIVKHFEDSKKHIDESAIDEIYNWSRKQTYCIQLICNKLYGSYKNVDSSCLNPVFKEIIEQESPLFSNYSNLLTDLQWKVLIAIAKEEPVENPFSNEFTGKYQLGATSSVSSALKTLVKKEIVVKEKAYFIHDVLLMRWLQSL